MRVSKYPRCSAAPFLPSLAAAAALTASGCVGPLEQSTSERLGRSITGALQAELAEAERHAAPRLLSREDRLDTLGIREDHLEQIQAEYSVGGYIEQLGNPFQGSETGEPVGAPLLHSTFIEFAEFSPSGDRIITGDDSGAARIWDAETGVVTRPPVQAIPLKSNDHTIFGGVKTGWNVLDQIVQGDWITGISFD